MCYCIRSSYHPQASGLVKHQNKITEDCIQKYRDESQNCLELLDDILFYVHITKHCSTKYTHFCMMYKRNPVTPFQLATKQRCGNPAPLNLSGESIISDDHVANMEHIYQYMLAKYTNIINSPLVMQQKCGNMRTFNKPFLVGDRILKKNMLTSHVRQR